MICVVNIIVHRIKICVLCVIFKIKNTHKDRFVEIPSASIFFQNVAKVPMEINVNLNARTV